MIHITNLNFILKRVLYQLIQRLWLLLLTSKDLCSPHALMQQTGPLQNKIFHFASDGVNNQPLYLIWTCFATHRKSYNHKSMSYKKNLINLNYLLNKPRCGLEVTQDNAFFQRIYELITIWLCKFNSWEDIWADPLK